MSNVNQRALADFIGLRDHAFALVDGTNCTALTEVLALEADASCLYTKSTAIPQEAAPWIVPITSPKTVEIFGLLPPDTHWGVLFHSDQEMARLHAHFRRFTMLTLPGGLAPSYFRFYDPRVFTDALEGLAPWRAAALTALMATAAVPSSPLLNISPDPLAPRAQFREMVFEIALPIQEPMPTGARLQFIGQTEKRNLDTLTYRRSGLKLMRDLQRGHPSAPDNDIRFAAQTALKLGSHHDMTSLKELRTLGDCLVLLGRRFPDAHPEALRILNSQPTERWQKGVWLSEWFENTGTRSAAMIGAIR